MNKSLSEFDPQIVDIMRLDLDRQRNCLTPVPLGNYAGKAVMRMQSSILANKDAKGYPGDRYFNGSEFTDQIETQSQFELPRERCGLG